MRSDSTLGRAGRVVLAMAALMCCAQETLRAENAEPEAAYVHLSPGAVAVLLAEDVGSTELTKLAGALADSDSETRAAAARAALVLGAAPLVPALIKAVETEQDWAAAREEFVALGELAPGRADEALFAAARRFDGHLDHELARALGRRGPAALALAPRLREIPLASFHWKPFFVWATREGRDGLPEAADVALATGDPQVWAELLALANDAQQSVGDDALATAVRTGPSQGREATYWHLLRGREWGNKVGPGLERALEKGPEAQGASADPVAQLAFELLGRALGRRKTDRSALLRQLTQDEKQRLPADAAVLTELKGDEKAAYGIARFGDRKAVKQRLEAAKRSHSSRELALRHTRVRTASNFPPGLVRDVLTHTGCAPGLEQWTGLEAKYDGKGVLEGIAFYPLKGLTPACQTAAGVLLVVAFRPLGRPPRPYELDVVTLPLFNSFIACAAEVDAQIRRGLSDEVKRVGGRIEKPRKISDVAPIYPESAKSQRLQGSVVLEAVISGSGCISSVEVLEDPAPDLRDAALRAVTFWRYTPTLFNGQPVPVIMTVTVNFKLR